METTSAAEGAITPSLGWVSLLTGLLVTPATLHPHDHWGSCWQWNLFQVRNLLFPAGCFSCGFNSVYGVSCMHRSEERAGRRVSFPQLISGWLGQVGKGGCGLHPSQNLWDGSGLLLCDDIFLQRRPEECGGCNLGHIPTPSCVYLHSFSSNIALSSMEAIKKSSSSCSCLLVKTS